MNSIEIKTLIDITNTKVNRSGQGSQLQLNQQRNFITLLQCLEIKSIIDYANSPQIEESNVKNLGFGSKYRDTHKFWTFRFTTDRDLVYQDNQGNPLGGLIEDLHEVPIIKNLTETVNIDKSIFDCKDDAYRNTLVRLLDSNNQ